jgi:myosin heavy subunit
VPGGFYNAAYGTASFAAGEAAEALSDYSFVWSDGTYLFDDQGTNTFNVLASGGTYIYSGLGVGVVLDANRSSWTTISDRNKKKNFKPVDCEKVLEKLVAMPIQQWNYKWEKDTDTPNLGPMAQDFKPAFYPGRDEKGISTLEFDGVELAAIQGLNQKLEERDQHLQAALKEKDAKIAQLEKALADLESSQQQKAEQWEARFEKLQKLVASLADKPETSLASASAMNPSK